MAAAVGLLAPLVLAGRVASQAPAETKAESVATPQSYPAPTNLKVLPADMSGKQVHDLMEQWKAGLGVDCNGCHAEVPGKFDGDGNPELNYADDSKPMKQSARLMYRMMDEINVKYVSQVDGSGVPVTCGTCHRGHMGPEPFSPKEEARQNEPPCPSAPAEKAQ